MSKMGQALPQYSTGLTSLCPQLKLACITQLQTTNIYNALKSYKLSHTIQGSYKLDKQDLVIEFEWLTHRAEHRFKSGKDKIHLRSNIGTLTDSLSKNLTGWMTGEEIALSEDVKKRIHSHKTNKPEALKANALGFWLQQRSNNIINNDDLKKQWRQQLVTATKVDPDYAEAWNNLGWFLLIAGNKQDNKDKVIDTFQISTQLKPNLIDTVMGLGKSKQDLMILKQGAQLNRSLRSHQIELAEILMKNHAFKKAIPLYERALAIREKVLGSEHPDTATSLNNLASLHQDMGAYNRAKLLNERALTIREKALGSAHPDIAMSLNNLASLHHDIGAYDKAKSLYERALVIVEKALGSEHPDTAKTLANLAGLHRSMGAYGEAKPLIERALAIMEKALGSEHHFTATSLGNLAVLHHDMGAYDKAKLLYERALASSKKTLGPDHPDTAKTLANLARLHQSMGAYVQAKPLYEHALAIFEKTLGLEHPTTAWSLSSLAGLHLSMGAYAKAKPLYEHALAIREKSLGSEHPDTVTSLNNLAVLHQSMDEYTEAKLLYEHALVISEKVLGSEHPATATSLYNLAGLHKSIGAYAEAKLLYERALVIRGKTLGLENPDTLLIVAYLAENTLSLNQWNKSHNSTSRLLAYYQDKIQLDSTKQLTFKNDSAAKRYQQIQFDMMRLHLKSSQRLLTNDKQVSVDKIIPGAFSALQLAHDPRNTQTMILTALKLAGKDQARNTQVNNLIQALHKRDKSSENYIASLTPSNQNTPEKQVNLKKAMQQAEKEVSESLITLKIWDKFEKLVDPIPLTIEQAHKYLKPHEAILAYVTSHDESYLMVVRKDKLPTLHKLNITRDQLKDKVAEFRQGLKQNKLSNAKGKTINFPVLDFNLDLSHKLYQALIQPVLAELKGITHLITVPEGSLQNLPFAALVTKKHEGKHDTYDKVHWLIKDFSLSQLPSLVSLRMIRSRSQDGQAENAFLGFGDPVLAKADETVKEVGKQGNHRSFWTYLPFISRSSGSSINPRYLKELDSLPFTNMELKALANKLKVDATKYLYLQDRDTETQLKALNKKGILKKQRVIAFATHALLAHQTQNIIGLEGSAESGLVFTPPEKGTSTDDGYLTASEISSLNLNADWVLLSACNTGLVTDRKPNGQKFEVSQNPDGLSSLAKSFFYAGSRNLLVSQWDVNDAAGSQMVSELFDEQQGRSKSQRLQQAMLHVINKGLDGDNECSKQETKSTLLNKLKCHIRKIPKLVDNKTNSWAHPIYWAPFVIVGDGV